MAEWRYSSTILVFCTRWRWVASFMPWPLCCWGKSPQNPLDRRLVVPRASLVTVEKRAISSPSWDSNPSLACSLPLYWLSQPCMCHNEEKNVISLFVLEKLLSSASNSVSAMPVSRCVIWSTYQYNPSIKVSTQVVPAILWGDFKGKCTLIYWWFDFL
jgi:hypothetical protein